MMRASILYWVTLLLVTGCSFQQQVTKNITEDRQDLQLSLVTEKGSKFNALKAQFYTTQKASAVVTTLIDLDLTGQWFEDVQSVETIAIDSPSEMVVRTVLDSPWPFKDREIIACVSSVAANNLVTLSFRGCSERSAQSNKYQRVKKYRAQWVVETLPSSQVIVRYSTWLEPGGYVPAYFYNSELLSRTAVALRKLGVLIEQG